MRAVACFVVATCFVLVTGVRGSPQAAPAATEERGIDTKIVNRPPGDAYGCLLPNKCVPFYQCTEENIINTDGEGLLDLRTKLVKKPPAAAAATAAETGGEADANKEGRVDDPSLSEKSTFGGGLPPPTGNLVGGNCPDILSVCCLDPEENSLLPPPKPHLPQCGVRHDLGIDVRITYDKKKVNKYGFDLHETQFGEFPWMGILLKESIKGPGDGVHFLCGASLIHPQVVMTAAHCLRPAQFNPATDRLLVRGGEWDTTNDYEPYPHQDRYVAKVVRHPDYEPGPYYNNIALLFLDQPFILERHIDTICLPKPGLRFPPKTPCVATGFGKDAFENGAYQKVMKQILVPIVDRDQCINQLRSTRLGPRFKLHPSYFCAGGKEGEDTCTGDGGGPLICKEPSSGVWIQAGIVAWGIGCANALPAVYTDVERFVDWIDYEVSEYFQLPKPYWGYTTRPLGGPGRGPGPLKPGAPGGVPGGFGGPGGPGVGGPGPGGPGGFQNGPGGPGGFQNGPGGPGFGGPGGFGGGPGAGGFQSGPAGFGGGPPGSFPGGPGISGPGSNKPLPPGAGLKKPGPPGGVPGPIPGLVPA